MTWIDSIIRAIENIIEAAIYGFTAIIIATIFASIFKKK